MHRARKSLIFFLLLNLIVFTTCAAKTDSPVEAVTTINDVRDFFPNQPGMTWVFEGSGNEYASFTRTVRRSDGDRVQLNDNNAGTSTGKVFHVTSDTIVQEFSTEEFYSDKSLFNEKPNSHLVYVQAPLKAGTFWRDSQGKREIVGINETVQVPAGSFQHVVKVKITPLNQKLANEQFEYYAAGTGLIMREFFADGYVITSKLKSFSSGSASAGAPINKIDNVYAETKPNEELEKIIIETLNIPDEYLTQTKYYYNYVDLNMDGADEIFVVVMGPYTSGTGGSTALHVIQTNQGLQVNQVFTLMRTPIIVSDKVTKGVKELVVRYSGGGVSGKYVVLTCSDGNFTPVNQGRAIDGLDGITGKAIISNDIVTDMEEGNALFLRKN